MRRSIAGRDFLLRCELDGRFSSHSNLRIKVRHLYQTRCKLKTEPPTLHWPRDSLPKKRWRRDHLERTYCRRIQAVLRSLYVDELSSHKGWQEWVADLSGACNSTLPYRNIGVQRIPEIGSSLWVFCGRQAIASGSPENFYPSSGRISVGGWCRCWLCSSFSERW